MTDETSNEQQVADSYEPPTVTDLGSLAEETQGVLSGVLSQLPIVASLEALTRVFASGSQVGPVTLSLPAGRASCLRGPSGAGKTTVLRMTAGLVTPTSGILRFEDDLRSLRRPLLGVHLNEDRSWYWRLSALDNLAFFARLHDDRRPLRTLLELVDLAPAADQRVGTLSTGMRSRLGLLRAMLGRPRLLLLDEPTRSLDREHAEALWELLRSLRADGTAMLIATHSDDEVVALGATTVDLSEPAA